jgi:hypothetical protein
MILAVLSCLFVFLGMYIGNKYDSKRFSINVLFGLFTINCLSSAIICVYPFLFINYHSSTLFYVFLSVILGYLLIKFINCKYEDSDNVSILGFTIINTSLFIMHRSSILFLIINIIYYILLGIYIKKSKSWIFILSGCIIGIILSFIKVWAIGFVYGINVGFIFYFILSIYNIVFRNKDKGSSIGLIVGFIVALLGGLL